MPSFNVLTEPFLTVVRLSDGKAEQVGLLGALSRAHEFREIRDPMPTAEFGLYRLLVAVTLDIFILEPGKKLKPLRVGERLQRGRFDENDLEAVAKYADRYAAHFDIFSETRPFLQTEGMIGEEKPVAGLLHIQPSGIGAAHFAHGHENDFDISPAVAARLLASIAPFMTAGGQGLSPSINGAPPVYALIQGGDLYKTLWLNLYGTTLPAATGEARPAWHGIGAVGGKRKTGASYAESLTWMPRRIRLTPDGPGHCTLTGEYCPTLIRTMKFSAGDGCDFSWLDPNCAYRIGSKGPVVLRMREGRVLWRDTGPLALLTGKQDFLRPAVVTQAVDILPDQPLHLSFYGLRTDMNAKVFEWQREDLIVPQELLHGSAFVSDAVEGMEQAELAAKYLRGAVKALGRRRRRKNEEQESYHQFLEKNASEKQLRNLASYTERTYWSSLRPCYDHLLSSLAELKPNYGADRATARSEWAKAVKGAAQASLHAAVDGLDTDAAALERQTRAFKSLDAGLYVLFLSPEEREVRRQAKKNKAANAAAVTKQGDIFA